MNKKFMREIKYYLESLGWLRKEREREREKGIKGEKKKGGSKYISVETTLRAKLANCSCGPQSCSPSPCFLPSPLPILRLPRKVNLGAPNDRFL